MSMTTPRHTAILVLVLCRPRQHSGLTLSVQLNHPPGGRDFLCAQSLSHRAGRSRDPIGWDVPPGRVQRLATMASRRKMYHPLYLTTQHHVHMVTTLVFTHLRYIWLELELELEVSL